MARTALGKVRLLQRGILALPRQARNGAAERAGGADRFELAMTSWADLTPLEKTALRHLPKGEVHDVPFRLIRRLRALGLADDSPDDRPTAAAWSSTGPSRDRQTAANDYRRPNPTDEESAAASRLYRRKASASRDCES